MNTPPVSPNRSTPVRIVMWITGALLACVLLGTLTVMSFNAYLLSDEKKILDRLDFINKGTITFEHAKFCVFSNFPNASLTLNNVELYDKSCRDEDHRILDAEELVVNFSIAKWRDKKIRLDRIQLNGGDIRIISDANGNSNFNNLFRNNGTNDHLKNNQYTKEADTGIRLDSFNFSIECTDINVVVIDTARTMKLRGLINHMKIRPIFSPHQTKGVIDLDLNVHELTFKEKNGSYLENSHLIGQLQLDKIDQTIFVSPSDLILNNQKINIHGQLSLDKSDAIIINIENKQTDMNEVLPMLPHNISNSITPYKVMGKFYTYGQIHLCPGSPALVDVQFRLQENDVFIQGELFNRASAKGRFVNRKYLDDRKWNEQIAPVHILVNQLKTSYQDFELSTDYMNIYAPPKSRIRLRTDVNVDGPAVGLSKWLNSDQFIFKQGEFLLNAKINGTLTSVQDLLLDSQVELLLKDSYLHYVPADAHIPLPKLSVSKKNRDANFFIRSTTLDNAQHINITGNISNILTLFEDNSFGRSQSIAFVQSDILNWNKIMDVFKNPQIESVQAELSERHAKRSIKSTALGINNKLNPIINISIDTFQYGDIINLYNLNGQINITDGRFLNLKKSSFSLDQGKVDVECKFDISHPDETSFSIKLHAVDMNLAEILPTFNYFDIDLLASHANLPNDFNLEMEISGRINDVSGLLPNTLEGKVMFDAKNHDQISGSITSRPTQTMSENNRSTTILLDGSPHVFNDYFDNETYFFQDTGSFHTEISYQGNVSSIDQLMKSAVVDLKLTDAAVLHKDLDVVFPLNELQVNLDHDSADFVAYMYSPQLDRELNIDGQVNSATELIFGNTNTILKTKVNVNSPIINLSHAKDIFSTSPDTSSRVLKSVVDNKIKKLVLSMMNRFNPHLQIGLDTFIVNDKIVIHDLLTGCQLHDSVHFILESTYFNFCDGQISLSAFTDLGYKNEEPFEMKIISTDLDLGQFIYALDYMNIPSLREADLVDGIVNFDMIYRSSLVDLQLQGHKTKAAIDFEVNDLQLKGVDVIDKLAKKLRLSKLFRDIRFGPISNEIILNGSRIDIPQMEIQSSSIDLFVEGYIDKNNASNVWLSIPLDNLKHLRGRKLKGRRGYAATRHKIFMELTSNNDDKMHSRFRLSKRKFYKKRGMRKQFRLDKKRDRAIRRKTRKEARQKKSDARSIDN